MILALISVVAVALAMGFALLVLWRRVERPAAEPTRKRHRAEYVTAEELEEAVEAAVEKATKDITFEWNEMYEKFDKLHLRLSKRAKRAEQQAGELPHSHDPAQRDLPGVLHLRRLGSP